MKILIVGLGGVTHTFRHWPERVLALALARRGHTVRAIGTRDQARPALAKSTETIDGVEVVRVSSGYWPNRELARALHQQPRPDVVHIMHPRNVLAAQTTTWALRQNIPTVYTWLGPFHDAYLTPDRERPFDVPPTYQRPIFAWHVLLQQLLREWQWRGMRDLLRNYRLHWPLRMATALVPCSNFEAEMMRRLGMPQPQVMVPLWIDVPFIQSVPVHTDTIAPYLRDKPRPWLLFVGQITPRKGYDLAIQALPAIIARYPTASLLVVSGINQAQRERLLELARQVGVEEHVHVLGYLPDEALINLYRSSDALLFPTRYEGFGLPLLEAMAAACPVVATDIPVVNEIVRDGKNGLLVPYNNATALAQAVILLLSQPDLRTHLVAGGCATLEYYQEDRLTSRIEAVYRHVIAKKATSRRG